MRAGTIGAEEKDSKSQGTNWKVSVLNMSNLEFHMSFRTGKSKIALYSDGAKTMLLCPILFMVVVTGTSC